MIKWIYNYFKTRKLKKQEAAFYNALYSPTLFTSPQRIYLKQLFPNQWIHINNIPQLDVFKIALAMTLFGFECDTPEKFKFCMDVLRAQQIMEYDPSSLYILRRVN